MTDQTRKNITDLVAPEQGVVVVVDDSDDPAIAAAVGAAAELAASSGVPCIVYDRSEETWADSQHPDGPLAMGDQRLEGRDCLRRRMSEVSTMGAEPLGWVPSLPTISAIETALSATSADVVVVPDELDRNLLERAVKGDSVAGTIVEMLDRNPALSATVVSVDPAGCAALAGS